MNNEGTIKVIANGKSFAVPEGQFLAGFLDRLGFEPGMVVVERNREAISPSETRSLRLADGDSLEIVRIVAGG